MASLPDKADPVRRESQVISRRAVRGSTPRNSAAPVPSDLFSDVDSVFSEGVSEGGKAMGVHLMCTFEGIRITALAQSYLPAPWFRCTALSYYAPEIRSRMSPVSISLVVPETDKLVNSSSRKPAHAVIVPPDAGMFIRPLSRDVSVLGKDSASPWVAFTTGPIIIAKVMTVPKMPESFREIPSLELSVMIADVIEAAEYYRGMVEEIDLNMFIQSLSSLTANTLNLTLLAPEGLKIECYDADECAENGVQFRLCLYFHEVSLANYDPI